MISEGQQCRNREQFRLTSDLLEVKKVMIVPDDEVYLMLLQIGPKQLYETTVL